MVSKNIENSAPHHSPPLYENRQPSSNDKPFTHGIPEKTLQEKCDRLRNNLWIAPYGLLGAAAVASTIAACLIPNPLTIAVCVVAWAALGALHFVLTLYGRGILDQEKLIEIDAFLTFLGTELKHLFQVSLHYFDDLTKQNPSALKGQPIVMVHGLFHSSSAWIWHKKYLEEQGYGPIYTVNLPSTIQDIEKNSEYLKQFLDQVAQNTGRNDIVLIGHSMGGLVSSHCATRTDVASVKSVITLGSPLQGTYIAHTLPIFKSCRQMSHRSPFVLSLAERVKARPEIRMFHFGSTHDELIIPQECAAFAESASEQVKIFPQVGHVSYLVDRKVSEALAGILEGLAVQA